MWTAIGLGVAFIFLEIGFFLLGFLKKQIDTLSVAQAQTTNTNFTFSTEEITNEEADLVDLIRDGDLKASVTFLKGRCENKLINFDFLPEPLQLILAQRLVNAINRGESPTWAELLSGRKNEKQTV